MCAACARKLAGIYIYIYTYIDACIHNTFLHFTFATRHFYIPNADFYGENDSNAYCGGGHDIGMYIYILYIIYIYIYIIYIYYIYIYIYSGGGDGIGILATAMQTARRLPTCPGAQVLFRLVFSTRYQ